MSHFPPSCSRISARNTAIAHPNDCFHGIRAPLPRYSNVRCDGQNSQAVEGAAAIVTRRRRHQDHPPGEPRVIPFVPTTAPIGQSVSINPSPAVASEERGSASGPIPDKYETSTCLRSEGPSSTACAEQHGPTDSIKISRMALSVSQKSFEEEELSAALEAVSSARAVDSCQLQETSIRPKGPAKQKAHHGAPRLHSLLEEELVSSRDRDGKHNETLATSVNSLPSKMLPQARTAPPLPQREDNRENVAAEEAVKTYLHLRPNESVGDLHRHRDFGASSQPSTSHAKSADDDFQHFSAKQPNESYLRHQSRSTTPVSQSPTKNNAPEPGDNGKQKIFGLPKVPDPTRSLPTEYRNFPHKAPGRGAQGARNEAHVTHSIPESAFVRGVRLSGNNNSASAGEGREDQAGTLVIQRIQSSSNATAVGNCDPENTREFVTRPSPPTNDLIGHGASAARRPAQLVPIAHRLTGPLVQQDVSAHQVYQDERRHSGVSGRDVCQKKRQGIQNEDRLRKKRARSVLNSRNVADEERRISLQTENCRSKEKRKLDKRERFEGVPSRKRFAPEDRARVVASGRILPPRPRQGCHPEMLTLDLDVTPTRLEQGVAQHIPRNFAGSPRQILATWNANAEARRREEEAENGVRSPPVIGPTPVSPSAPSIHRLPRNEDVRLQRERAQRRKQRQPRVQRRLNKRLKEMGKHGFGQRSLR